MPAYTLPAEFVDQAAERALLAAIARRPELYWDLLDLLPAEAFAAEAPTAEALLDAIDQGAERLPAVPEAWLSADDPEATARHLADLLQRRLLAEELERLGGALYDQKRPAQDLAGMLEEAAARVQQAVRELRTGRLVALPELLPEVLRDVAARRQAVRERGAATVGLPLGLPQLDRLLGGLQPGLHLLAAEPGQGKTTFTLQVAAHVVRAGYPALVVSFEESLPRLALKALCQAAGLEIKRFADGFADPAELERAAQEYGPKLAGLHLLEGTARLTVAQVKARALQILAKAKASRLLVVVDYAQRWAASRREFTDFRHVVSGLVGELRELALRLDSPILVISSQNRLGQGQASLTSLKESGDLEYSADTVMFLVEDEKRNVAPPARAVNLVLAKNRYGDKGRVHLIFRPHVGVFTEEAPHR